MAYFLKKTYNKKGIYLQIYEGFYDPEKKHARQRSYRPLGYVHELIKQGIDDPLTYFDKEIKELNLKDKLQRHDDSIKLISDESPEKHLGYFILKAINDDLGVKNHLDFFQNIYDFNFNAYDVLSSLIYARTIFPSSKIQTYNNVIPKLYDSYAYSKDQMYRAVEFFGLEYKKIIEIYNHFIQKKYGFETSSTYFDCTNFYFEIDQEDSLRKKGPSKENRKEPLVSMGLLLDYNQIPMGMSIFPGNESEVKKLPEIISELKTRENISGKTIRVADKGLNTTNNIIDALAEGDGYIFSKSIKKLPDVEKTWVLLENDYVDYYNNEDKLVGKYKEFTGKFPYRIKNESNKVITIHLKEKRVITYNPELARKQKREINKLVEKARQYKSYQAKRSEYGDSAKFVNFESTDNDGNLTDGKVKVSMNEKAISEALELCGYNMIVTSETDFSAKYLIETYKNLWRIEETFRVMKSYLDARPVYLQKEASIKGHFLICYLSVVLLRLLQFKVLENQYSSETLIGFIRTFKVANISPRKYMNLTRSSDFIKQLSHKTHLPLELYYLSKGQVNDIMDYKF